MATPLACGSWPSPITSELIVSTGVGLGHPGVDGGDTHWIEARPTEQGRQVLVRRRSDGTVEDVVGAPHNVRTRVHEYGGRCYAVRGGTVWFSDFASGRLHRLDPGGEPAPITPEGDLRYADLVVDAPRDRLVCVHEDHTTGAAEAVNGIAAVPLGGGAPQMLAGGHDFAAAPRLSPDGSRLAWLTWDHPRMPWDGTDLWVADLDAGGVPGEPLHVAGGPEESVAEPLWAPDGSLWFSSDRDGGWWNLHRWDGERVERVAPMEAETGGPMWQLGWQHLGFLADGRAAVAATNGARQRLLVVEGPRGASGGAPGGAAGAPAAAGGADGAAGGAARVREIAILYDELASELAVRDNHVLVVAASGVEEAALVDIDVDAGTVEVLRRSSSLAVDRGFVSVAEHVEFPTTGGATAHAYYYPPRHPDHEVPDGERPPLRVVSHGGPTSSTSTSLRWGIQYYTSRGFGVVSVNYGGSTGYGRAYRERLAGQWGVVDVDDCVNAARHLVDQGRADPARVAICGGSAGGYTTLRALTSTEFFRAGCSLFGLGDLSVFVGDTHKFESRYLEKLIGPYPERRELYEERSPVNHVDRLRTAVILFQGLEDAVVPPNQAELFFAAALASGVPCCYEPFEGEQHGFRIAANIRRSLDGEFAFYAAVFGFTPAERLEPPLDIRNL